jgi:hypothetical protein
LRDHHNCACGLGGRDDSIARLQRQRHRLLTDDVLAVAQRRQDVLFVCAGGRTYIHDVHAGAFQHGAHILENSATQGFGNLRALVPVDVGKRCYFNAVQGVVTRCVRASHESIADNADFEHGNPSFARELSQNALRNVRAVTRSGTV